jgi:replicative DNA helicase
MDKNGVIDYLKKAKGWQPDMVIIDYLELMLSTRGDENSENYLRQKSVATQIRALAARHNVCIFTATQTNRSGNESESQEKGIDVTQIAESYGKAMSIDYLISINQTQEEYQKAKDSGGPADARLFFAKNRNGQKFVTVPVRIYYNSMYIKPEQQL